MFKHSQGSYNTSVTTAGARIRPGTAFDDEQGPEAERRSPGRDSLTAEHGEFRPTRSASIHSRADGDTWLAARRPLRTERGGESRKGGLDEARARHSDRRGRTAPSTKPRSVRPTDPRSRSSHRSCRAAVRGRAKPLHRPLGMSAACKRPHFARGARDGAPPGQ